MAVDVTTVLIAAVVVAVVAEVSLCLVVEELKGVMESQNERTNASTDEPVPLHLTAPKQEILEQNELVF